MQDAIGADLAGMVRAELAKVISSPDFDASDRNRRFLSYVVEETLAGRADRIKAYAIATTVFGRDHNFDSQLDSIVRIEAGRLRRSLELYYLTAGAQDRVRIVVPRGTYAPDFVTSAEAPATRPARQTSEGLRARPVILVRDFVEEGPVTPASLACGLTRQVVIGLTRFTNLWVFGQHTTQAKRDDADLTRIRDDLGVNFFVMGVVSQSDDRLKVDALLVDAQTGRYLWAESFDRPCKPAEILGIRDEIAASVARIIGQPWGVIFSNLAAESDGRQPREFSSFDAVMQFYRYTTTLDPITYPTVRKALERAVAAEPDYGEAWSCLSRLQMDGVRFGYRIEGDPPAAGMLNRAIESARRAIGLSPRSSQCFLALGMAYWFTGDVEGSFGALTTALGLNPNDTETMAELGLRQCLRKDWEAGVPRITAAYDRNPALPPNHRIGLALWHVAEGRYHDAFEELARMSAVTNISRAILLAITHHALGERAKARAAIDEILQIDPQFGTRVVADLTLRNVHPELITMIVEGLTEAGLHDASCPAVAAG